MLADIALILHCDWRDRRRVRLRQNYRQRLRQFEEMYVQRYCDILDRFSLAAMSGHPAEARPAESDEKAIRASIRLCEDELEVRAEGWISDATYVIWVSSIRAQMQLPMFLQVWQRVPKEGVFPFHHLEQLLDRHEMHRMTLAKCACGIAGFTALPEYMAYKRLAPLA